MAIVEFEAVADTGFDLIPDKTALVAEVVSWAPSVTKPKDGKPGDPCFILGVTVTTPGDYFNRKINYIYLMRTGKGAYKLNKFCAATNMPSKEITGIDGKVSRVYQIDDQVGNAVNTYIGISVGIVVSVSKATAMYPAENSVSGFFNPTETPETKQSTAAAEVWTAQSSEYVDPDDMPF